MRRGRCITPFPAMCLPPTKRDHCGAKYSHGYPFAPKLRCSIRKKNCNFPAWILRPIRIYPRQHNPDRKLLCRRSFCTLHMTWDKFPTSCRPNKRFLVKCFTIVFTQCECKKWHALSNKMYLVYSVLTVSKPFATSVFLTLWSKLALDFHGCMKILKTMIVFCSRSYYWISNF